MTDEKLQCLADMDFQWNGAESNKQKKQFTDLWNQRFKELQKFKEKHGHCRVPGKTPKLGAWVMNQKSPRFRASNSKEKVDKLRNIGVYE